MEEQEQRLGGRKIRPGRLVELPLQLQVPRIDGRKISPGGMIDLPFVARVALGFRKDEAKRLRIEVTPEGVVLSPLDAYEEATNSVKASPLGLLRLSEQAHRTLSNGEKGRYNLDIQEQHGRVVLRPA